MIYKNCKVLQIILILLDINLLFVFSNNAFSQTNSNLLHADPSNNKADANVFIKFNTSMNNVKTNIETLQGDSLSTLAYIDLIVSNNAENLRKGYDKAIDVINKRLSLEDQILDEIKYSSSLYNELAEVQAAKWNIMEY